jgi:hypothetical protein
MTVFYLIILGLDKFFPYEKQNSVGKSNIAVDNTDNDNED